MLINNDTASTKFSIFFEFLMRTLINFILKNIFIVKTSMKQTSTINRGIMNISTLLKIARDPL